MHERNTLRHTVQLPVVSIPYSTVPTPQKVVAKRKSSISSSRVATPSNIILHAVQKEMQELKIAIADIVEDTSFNMRMNKAKIKELQSANDDLNRMVNAHRATLRQRDDALAGFFPDE